MRKLLTALFALLFVTQVSWANVTLCEKTAMAVMEAETGMDCHKEVQAKTCPLQAISTCYDVDEIKGADLNSSKEVSLYKTFAHFVTPEVQTQQTTSNSKTRAPPEQNVQSAQTTYRQTQRIRC